jgi:hypothetical protein
MVAGVAPQVAVITAGPPIAAIWCVPVRGTGRRCLPRAGRNDVARRDVVTLWERGHGLAALRQRRALVQPGEPVHGPGEARAAASQPP